MTSQRKAPRFDRKRPSSARSSSIKTKVPRTGTRAEHLLRRALWARGFRYRLHAKDLPGKPDLVFRGKKVAVFVDGDFWHGRHWTATRQRLLNRANSDYWIAKIEYNIERDKRQRSELEEHGWAVLRMWETDIQSDPEWAADQVAKALALAKRSLPRSFCVKK